MMGRETRSFGDRRKSRKQTQILLFRAVSAAVVSFLFHFILFFRFFVFSVVFVASIFICTLGIFHSFFLSFKRFIQPLSKKKLKCVFLKAAEPNMFSYSFSCIKKINLFRTYQFYGLEIFSHF